VRPGLAHDGCHSTLCGRSSSSDGGGVLHQAAEADALGFLQSPRAPERAKPQRGSRRRQRNSAGLESAACAVAAALSRPRARRCTAGGCGERDLVELIRPRSGCLSRLQHRARGARAAQKGESGLAASGARLPAPQTASRPLPPDLCWEPRPSLPDATAPVIPCPPEGPQTARPPKLRGGSPRQAVCRARRSPRAGRSIGCPGKGTPLPNLLSVEFARVRSRSPEIRGEPSKPLARGAFSARGACSLIAQCTGRAIRAGKRRGRSMRCAKG